MVHGNPHQLTPWSPLSPAAGQELQSTADLKTGACLTFKAPPPEVKKVLARVPAEVLDRVRRAGCGVGGAAQQDCCATRVRGPYLHVQRLARPLFGTRSGCRGPCLPVEGRTSRASQALLTVHHRTPTRACGAAAARRCRQGVADPRLQSKRWLHQSPCPAPSRHLPAPALLSPAAVLRLRQSASAGHHRPARARPGGSSLTPGGSGSGSC